MNGGKVILESRTSVSANVAESLQQVTSTSSGSKRALDVSLVGSGGSSGSSVSVAGYVPLTFVRNVYSSVNVTTSAYVQLIASTSAAINALQIFDSSGQTMKIAFGAAAAEVDKFLVIPGGNGFLPVLIPAGTRVSIRAVSASAIRGEIDINAFT